jgi:hypothetical protein
MIPAGKQPRREAPGGQRALTPRLSELGREQAGSGQPRMRRWWPTLTVLALLAIGATFLSPTGRHQWALSLFRQPTPYTVLSFTYPSALPSIAIVNEPIRISFTVVNREDREIDYRYVVSSNAGSDSRVLRVAARAVAAGAAWTVSTTIRPRCGASRCRVEVSLPGHPETIDFLINLKAAEGRRHARDGELR